MDSDNNHSNSGKPNRDHWTPAQMEKGRRFMHRFNQAKAAYQKRAEQQSTSEATPESTK